MDCRSSIARFFPSLRSSTEHPVLPWYRPAPINGPSGVELLHGFGLLALCLYAFGKPGLLSVGKWAEGAFMLTALILLLVQYRVLLRDLYFKLLLLAILVQLATWVASWLDPDPMVSTTLRPDRLNKLMFFLATAILMAGRLRNIFWVWGSGILGLLWVVLGSSADWHIWQQGLSGLRVDFGIRNAQHTAMYFGILMLGCLCFSRRWLSASRQLWWRLPLWLGTLTVAALGIMVTQTRAIFLAIFAALLLALFFWVWLKRPRWWVLALLLGSTALLLLTLGPQGLAQVEKRYKQEAPVIEQLLQGNWENIPYTSVGIRVNTWKVAAAKIVERPWLGWGPDSRRALIKQSAELPAAVRQQFGHLHNFFIEMQLSYGIAGSMFLLLLAGALVRESWQAWRANVMPTDFLVFFCAFFIYWFIVNNFESYLTYKTGIFVFNIVIGGLVTLGWRNRYGAFFPGRGAVG